MKFLKNFGKMFVIAMSMVTVSAIYLLGTAAVASTYGPFAGSIFLCVGGAVIIATIYAIGVS